MTKKGFSLVEIMIAMTIASMLGGILFQTMQQITKVITSITEVSSFDMRIAVISNSLDKDLNGAFVPIMRPIKSEEEIKEKKEEAVPNQDKDDKNKQKVKPKKEKKEETVPVPRLFLSENDTQGNLQSLTFITTNPVTVYNTGKQRPVRVLYELKPSQEYESGFSLYRSETPGYMRNKQKDGKGNDRSIMLADGIRSIKCEFTAIDKQEESKELDSTDSGSRMTIDKDDKKKVETKKEEKKVEIKKELVKKPDWNANEDDDQEQEKDDEKKPRTLPLIPEFIKINITLALNDNPDHDRSFECDMMTPEAFGSVVIGGRKPVKEKNKKDKDDKFGHLFEKNKLSQSLHEKLGDWQPEDEKKSGGKK